MKSTEKKRFRGNSNFIEFEFLFFASARYKNVYKFMGFFLIWYLLYSESSAFRMLKLTDFKSAPPNPSHHNKHGDDKNFCVFKYDENVNRWNIERIAYFFHFFETISIKNVQLNIMCERAIDEYANDSSAHKLFICWEREVSAWNQPELWKRK